MPAPTDLPPSIMSHVSIGTNDYARAKTFYDAVLATLHIGVAAQDRGDVRGRVGELTRMRLVL